MAYVKPFKVIQDAYVTLGDWNELQESDEAAWDVLAINHSDDEDALAGATLGEHEDNLIPFAVLHVQVETFGSVVTTTVDGQEAYAGAALEVERVGVGLYRVPLQDFLDDGGAPFGTVTTMGDARVNFNDGSANGGTFVGLEIELLEFDGGSTSWVAEDLSFTLAIYRGRV